jgi:hypothetical protein
MGQFNDKRLIARGTASLHKLQRDAVARRTHGDPKRGRRGIACGSERPDHEKQRLARLRRKVQASERFGAHVGLPEEQCAKRPGAKDLLTGPQRIGRLRGSHDVDRRFGQTPVRRRFRLEAVRRL